MVTSLEGVYEALVNPAARCHSGPILPCMTAANLVSVDDLAVIPAPMVASR
jgi:hypothetical protein